MIKFDLSKKIAVITGGAQGFGLAITERFIQSGAEVIIWDIDEKASKKAVSLKPDYGMGQNALFNVLAMQENKKEELKKHIGNISNAHLIFNVKSKFGKK